jgi:hypothetical protein
MNLNMVNPYFAAAENAAAAQRAANVRKKLRKGAAELAGSETPDESQLVDQWTASSQNQGQSEDK